MRRARKTVEIKVALYLACGAAMGRLGAAIEFLEATIAPPPPHPEPPAQCLAPDAVRFVCPRLHIEMPVRECLEKRGLKWVTGRRRGAPRSPECIGCETGEAFAWICPGIRLRPPSEPPAVMPLSQRLAKRASALATPCAYAESNPLTEASDMTPTDETDWRG